MTRFLVLAVLIALVIQVLGKSLLDASIEKRNDENKRSAKIVTGSCGRCFIGCPTGQEIRQCTADDFKNNRVICECTPIAGSKRDVLLNEE